MNKFSVDSIQKDLEFCEKALNRTQRRKNRRFAERERKDEPKLSADERPYTKSQVDYPKKKSTFKRKTREQLLHEKNIEMEKECTFKPRINEISSIKSERSSFVDRLHTTKQTRDYERAKKQKEDEIIRQHCTFTPNTNPNHHKNGRGRNSTIVPPDFYDYLHHSNTERQRYLEQLRIQKENNELAECSFRPHIGLTTQTMLSNQPKSSQIPLFERVGEVQREKENYLSKLKIDNEKRLDLKFKPSLNEKSRRLLRQRDRSLTNMRNYEMEERKRKLLNDQYKEYTFEPKVSKGTKKIFSEIDKFRTGDFFTRQEEYEKEYEKRRVMRQKNNKSVFQRNVSLEREMYKRKKNIRDKLNQNEAEEVFQRLGLLDQKERESRMRILERKYGLPQGSSFRPKTNKDFNQNIPKTDLHELVTNESVERRKLRARREKAIEMKKTCTFQPKLVTSNLRSFAADGSLGELSINKYRITDPTSSTHGGVNMDRVRRLKIEKEKERELKKRINERDELKKCTFQPDTKKSIVSYHKHGGVDQSSQPMFVNGYHQHLAKCDQAKQLKEEKENREFEIFHQWGKGKTKNWKKRQRNKRKKGKPDITVPKPFQLHADNNYDTYEVKRLARMGNEKYETSNVKYLFRD